jgi:integrase
MIFLTTQDIRGRLEEYLSSLASAELSSRTREKYHGDIQRFLIFCGEGWVLDKQTVIEYKKYLLGKYKVSTVNSYLISINRYFSWLERSDCNVKSIRVQRRTGLEDVVTADEYARMLSLCKEKRKEKNYLLLRTLAGTGIRVGELALITREAAERKTAAVTHKGKCRCIFLSTELSHLLLEYCQRRGIQSGVIFHGSKKNVALHPSGVWKLLKRIAAEAGIDCGKIYPHNLRHLFAKTYMEKVGNIFELADLLGHSSVETTRIYALTSNAEKRRRVEELML